MRNDEITSELRQEGARRLLETAPMARVAYNGMDGLPRVIPIGFFWNGNAIVVCTAVTAPKVRALAERPEVAVTIDVGNTPADAQALIIRGTATLETVEGIASEYIAGSSKVLSESEVAEFARQVQEMYDQMVRISIVPTWARYFDFGAGRMPAFLLDLANSR
jgi:nitroimidazol reductase NimA-like FMN-containing flavoprotein (pyridoxamine 5'-phosphate oxidase superfamily)